MAKENEAERKARLEQEAKLKDMKDQQYHMAGVGTLKEQERTLEEKTLHNPMLNAVMNM